MSMGIIKISPTLGFHLMEALIVVNHVTLGFTLNRTITVNGGKLNTCISNNQLILKNQHWNFEYLKRIFIFTKKILRNFYFETLQHFYKWYIYCQNSQVVDLGKMKSNENEKYVVQEVLVQVHSTDGGAPEGGAERKGVPKRQENARVLELPLM